MTVVYTISGKAQHGKDTFANLLKKGLEEEGYRVCIIHFADYLKFVCKEYFEWNGKKNTEGRTILQTIGTNLARANNPNIWANVTSEFIKAFKTEFDFFLIPDCRFPNEVETMKKLFNSRSIKIERMLFDNGLTPEQKSHISETALDEYKMDYGIQNQNNMQSMERNVKYFLRIALLDYNDEKGK